MIAFTCFVWLLTVVYSFIVMLYNLSFQSTVTIDDSLFFKALTQPVQWVINFITILALLYLFDYQGRKRRTRDCPNRDLTISLGTDSLKGTRFTLFIESTLAPDNN